ncbi:Enhancer of polycomb-like protein 1 [Cyphellophora attinorum]|uniref:Enhancer of polycomb-like protein n=1 Tax=Cyphellophora attinorum TaxID=1664694 RepID=A0A0N0NJV1_9EURO|nr:Enhancer of polycomb-like protein 1 [Phialophora attinorum]KPI37318.1 Enhancer of polycomb-like protein 1 [Phialophora attinorum]
MSSARRTTTRPKKLQSRQHIQIVREDQIENVVDVDSGRGPVETGVEKAEEAEYHLQQAIKASQAAKDGAVPDGYIPTPPTIASDIQYDVLYTKGWQQPATYIRSSATVEDCAGTPYCMDEEDELALKLINAKLQPNQPQISEDQFEDVMNFFEQSAHTKQPYAAVDSPPVLSLDELQEQFDESHPDHVRALTRIIYEHWALRRTTSSNRDLSPHLKFETGQESDDSDPYVCFRRRELRQIRKTRNRDLQSADKLRKLRMELESARNLMLMVKRREQMRKESLEIDRLVFEQRQAFRETKRKLAIKGDEELLINQKKQKVTPGMTPNQAAFAQQMRMPGLPHGTSHDLRTLEEVWGEKTRTIQQEIHLNVEKHKRWNEGYVDRTKAPLTPEPEPDVQQPEFRKAMAAQLPTPPASNSEEETQPNGEGQIELKERSRSSTPFRYASPVDDSDGPDPMPAFRRRIGRGGRVMIDRRFPLRTKAQPVHDPVLDDRWKFDTDHSDSEVEDQVQIPESSHIALRAHLAAPQQRPIDQSTTVPGRRLTIPQSEMPAVAAS